MPNFSSTIRSFDGNKTNDYILALKETYKSVQLESKAVQEAYQTYVLMHMNIAMVRENFCFNNPHNFYKKYKNMKRIVQEPIFKKAIDKTKKRECMSFRMAPILCLKLHFYFGASMIYSIRALQNYLREQ